jgi:TolB-like protein/class 3 adenylate cyclase/Tfp pilus assembly protein PilF
VERPHVERKLAAILAADVAGYSRLMGADEEGTLAQLKSHRRALVDPKIREHRGKIIKTTGDGMLVEFASVVDAVRCAVEIQRGMAERNAGVPQNKRIEFRVGINLGDIIHDDNDIFGDGVNVAARLEGLAEPGGICVSQSVRDPVRDKLGFTFEDMGEQTVKNIARPIPTFRVRFEGAEPPQRARPALRPGRNGNVVVAWVVGLAAVCAVAALAVGFWPSRGPRPVPAQPVATAQSAPLPLLDKPSVAVLPFTSIGGDAQQEHLADGITEDVITDLSRYRDFFVIARNSVFTYKGKAVSVQQVGRDLGVRYVLEGSIQTSGDRVRVTAQLIEAATNVHVWSERYDRALDGIFDVQNAVTQKIAAALGGTTGAVAVAETASARRKPPANLQAYDYYVLGNELALRQTKEENVKAEELLKKAIDLDPQFARAYTGLAFAYNNQAQFGWTQDILGLMDKAKSLALQAIALDSTSGWAYAVSGLIYSEIGEFDHALAAFEQAYVMNPNDSDILVMYGNMLLPFVGRAKEGVEMVDRAFRLNPHHPDWYNLMADAAYATGQYNQAIAMLRRFTGDLPVWSIWLLAISDAQLGQQKDAAAAMAELSRRFPDPSFERMLSEFGGIRDEAVLARYLEGAHKASMRDCATEAELQKYPKTTHLALCDAKRATN